MGGRKTKIILSEKEKMLSGKPYDAMDKELRKLFFKCKDLIEQYNKTECRQKSKRKNILKKLFDKSGNNLYIEPPFYCDYGCFTTFGNNVYLNTDCVFLDCAKITIGDNVLFAPEVHIYTAYHDINPTKRFVNGKIIDISSPVTIGNNVWIGGKAIILPGVKIGNNSVIGAGSVVTKDIPANAVAAGNPCKVIKRI